MADSMSERDRPHPPDDLDETVAAELATRDSDALLAIAEYAVSLAEWKQSAAEPSPTVDGSTDGSGSEVNASSDSVSTQDGGTDGHPDSDLESDSDSDPNLDPDPESNSDPDPDPDEYPPDVPARATVSIVDIAGETYRYYQWREADEIRSATERLASD